MLDLSLFRQAVAEIEQRVHWERDPESLRQLGLVMHRFAPRSRDRTCTYSCARALYRTAAARTRDPALRAEVLTLIGSSYFEEGRLDEAVAAFEASLSLARWKHAAHLGLIAIACAQRDLAAIRRRCEHFGEDVPCWHLDREVVALLAADPDFAFLRAAPALFHECFGGYPEHLQALHDRYCIEALDRALDAFDTREDGEPTDALEVTKVVRRTFSSVGEIVCSSACTLQGISPDSLQARIGF
ncbi:MAG TPA: tetratricopeptide repeat protein [Kofleriaceae bacterium]|nr:tetratricopeptide repeat protein [Kofleriaceae bacterium]